MPPGYLTCEISQRPRWITFYLGLGVHTAGVLLLLALNSNLQSSVLAEPVVISHYIPLVAPPPPHEGPPQPKKVDLSRAQPMPETVAKAESAQPTYTQEARGKGVQGEVLLDVVLEASGPLHINRVVRGLGTGPTIWFWKRQKKIQVRPAVRNGQPYDYVALVHIRSELAD